MAALEAGAIVDEKTFEGNLAYVNCAGASFAAESI